uniref:Transmembrane protein 107 n=1 Tax=Ditylenchus dipsaci TaxID=166011 RepID=A0A915EGU2_9BILA
MNITTSNFLSIIAHGSMIFCILLHRVDQVKSGLPPSVSETTSIYIDHDAMLSTVLSVTMISLVVEALFTFRQVSPSSISVMSLFAIV